MKVFKISFLFAFFFTLHAADIDHITIAVRDNTRASQLFNEMGFTLKTPHEYKSGLQEGLIAQSIRFTDGSYIQLVSVKEPIGDLAKWYHRQLKKGEGAVTLTLIHPSLKELEKKFKKENLNCERKNFSGYQWLSFKTDSPYQHVSFINYQTPLFPKKELLNHRNGALGIKKLTLNSTGESDTWAKIMSLSNSLYNHLEFNHLGFKQAPFISEIILKKNQSSPSKTFKIGRTLIKFQ